MTGIGVTQSALTQDAMKQAEGPVGAAYQELRAQVRPARVVYTDDTSWRIGGDGAYLMAFDTCDTTVYQVRTRHGNEQVRELVRIRRLRDRDNQRLLDGIGLQHDQGRVLNFLYQSEVEPTNNRAERALRPAVIARKVSQCSKTQRGADAFAAFTSVVRTAIKRGAATVTQTLHTLRRPAPPPDST